MGASRLRPADTEAVVQAYLTALRASLPVGRRDRLRIVAEIDDGLRCAIEAHLADGLEPRAAAEAAAAQFGDPRLIARQYAAALAPALARRIGTLLVATGPLVGLGWLAAGSTANGWAARLADLLAVAPPIGALLIATVPAAVLAAIGGGFALRHNGSSRVPTIAARFAAAGCVAADLTLIIAVLGQSRALPVAAVALSTLRSAGAATAWRRLSRLSAAGC